MDRNDNNDMKAAQFVCAAKLYSRVLNEPIGVVLRYPYMWIRRGLLAVSIRLVGWCYSEPSESDFEIVERLDMHAPVHRNDFAKPQWVKHWFFKNIREFCVRKNPPISELKDRVGREFTIVEAFHRVRISRKSPPIEEHFLNLVSCNSLKHFQKGSLCLLQRKLPPCAYVKKP